MKGNQKGVLAQRIDLELIAGITRSAQKRGETKATLLERAISQYLSNDVELTAIERSNFEKSCIENELKSIANSLNVEVFGDISSKIVSLMAVCAGFETIFPLRDSTKKAKLSLFEALIDVKHYDEGLFNEIVPQLKRFKKLFVMFTQTTFGNEKL